MAGFTLNFNANTIDDYYICYKNVADPLPYTCTTVSITTLGPQTVDIDIPNNIYCDPADLEGYIIAACQPQTDANGDGIPDAAILFSLTIGEVVDPCDQVLIQCTQAPITNIVLTGGVGCTDGAYPLLFTDGVAITPATGTVTISNSGANINVSITTTGLYSTIPTTVDTSAFGCTTPPTTQSIATGTCVPLDLTDIECAGHMTNTSPPLTPSLNFGESFNFCVDSEKLGLVPSDYTVTEVRSSCHCADCIGLYVSNPLAGKTVTVYYQTCWFDDSQTTYPGPIVTYGVYVPAGATGLFIDCIIKDTAYLEGAPDGTLISYGPCDGSGPTP
jgi:hypothetical protein